MFYIYRRNVSLSPHYFRIIFIDLSYISSKMYKRNSLCFDSNNKLEALVKSERDYIYIRNVFSEGYDAFHDSYCITFQFTVLSHIEFRITVSLVI